MLRRAGRTDLAVGFLDDPVAGVVREVTAALVPEEWLGAGWSRPVRGAAFRLVDARGGSGGRPRCCRTIRM
ncbi:hypothetical protein [Streptomyces sp. NPDC050548]|uniref:hypothetical protein n=1 Tax=Streptomyces sp. NPDC050548 TaxID=3365629 RepID=UPI003788B98F